MPCRPRCCPPACCPVVIRTKAPAQQSQCCSFQLPPVNVCCEVPPPPRQRRPPTRCCIPVMICEDEAESGGCGQQRQRQRPSASCCMPQPSCCMPQMSCCPSPCPEPCCVPPCPACPCPPRESGGDCGSGRKNRREKRWPQCNFLKPCIDTRIYRDGEHMAISYAGHIPGEQFIHGRNLPTSTTFAKRRLCTFTPYEFVDPDGCCSFP